MPEVAVGTGKRCWHNSALLSQSAAHRQFRAFDSLEGTRNRNAFGDRECHLGLAAPGLCHRASARTLKNHAEDNNEPDH
jgi:hypothetical protein